MVKEIYFDDVFVGYGTKATIKDELETEKTPTFSGALVDGDPNPSVTVSIELLKAGTIDEYIALERKIKYAKTNPITVQLKMSDKGKDGLITVKEYAYNCLISSDEVEFDPVKRTAMKLELAGESRKKYVNNIGI